MSIVIRRIDDVAIIDINIDIYDEDVEYFKETIRETVGDGGCLKLLLLFHSVNTLCSSAFEAIIKTHVTLKKLGGSLCIANIDKNVKKLFELTRMDKVIDICSNESDALELLKG